LLVFLMAAMIAISLYIELPRVAFQAERQKEQLLMERGMQYKRAIGLFLRTNKNTRWPASIEELENFNNRRSLRKRYIDPMTGKDEWRLIHIQNGVLIDSITNKKPDSQSQGLQATGFINEIQSSLNQQGSGTPNVNPGLRRRPSDGGPSVGPDGQPIQGAPGGTAPSGGYSNTPPAPGSVPPAPPASPGFSTSGSVIPGANGGSVPAGAPGGQGGIAGIIGGAPSNGQPGASGQTNNQSSGGLMGGLSGGLTGGLTGGGLTGGGSTTQPTVPGAPPQGFPGSVTPGVPSGAPGANGQPGGIPINPAAQSAAAGLLQNLLTQPRPGGMPGASSPVGGGGVMGSGIAGVASKAEGQSIMVYGDRTDFSEWEFIYDPMKFQVQNPNVGAGGSGPGVPASQLANNSGFSQAGTPIGTGPGGTQPSTMPGGISAAFGATGANTSGMSLGAPGGTPPASGAPGSTSPGSAPPVAGSGSGAFGQAGLNPDIRPGKK
jgi:hypothetical protein